MTDLEALYRQHAPAVFRFALSLSGSRAAADDLT
jgi:DNA-directed RNA polymerase specialized sigma24 family protein